MSPCTAKITALRNKHANKSVPLSHNSNICFVVPIH